MKILLLLLLLSSCSMIEIQCFSIDGKAALSCERDKLAKEYCGSTGVEYNDYWGLKCAR